MTVDQAPEPRVPQILVALGHPTMRRYVCDLVEQGCRCWVATTPPELERLNETFSALRPDVVIVNDRTFAAVLGSTSQLPADSMMVIGAEPDPAYHHAALRSGAGAWVSQDDLSRRLLPELRRMLKCGDCFCQAPTPS